MLSWAPCIHEMPHLLSVPHPWPLPVAPSMPRNVYKQPSKTWPTSAQHRNFPMTHLNPNSLSRRFTQFCDLFRQPMRINTPSNFILVRNPDPIENDIDRMCIYCKHLKCSYKTWILNKISVKTQHVRNSLMNCVGLCVIIFACCQQLQMLHDFHALF